MIMASTQVQVRIPKELLKEIDRWVKDGRFVSRSEAVKSIVALYEERERTREFYRLLTARSQEAKKGPGMLVPLDEIR